MASLGAFTTSTEAGEIGEEVGEMIGLVLELLVGVVDRASVKLNRSNMLSSKAVANKDFMVYPFMTSLRMIGMNVKNVIDASLLCYHHEASMRGG